MDRQPRTGASQCQGDRATDFPACAGDESGTAIEAEPRQGIKAHANNLNAGWHGRASGKTPESAAAPAATIIVAICFFCFVPFNRGLSENIIDKHYHGNLGRQKLTHIGL